jgi:O-acetyl-ADP-ribose deacetylase (regulator of RNase III)
VKGRIVLREGDLAAESADAIVNAANSALVLGAGVAGAIAAKGGDEIQAECDRQGPIAVGDAAITGAGRLEARFVIHAASMPPGGAATEDSLRSSFRRSLELASEHGCRTLAAPAIGAGIAGLPLQRCAEILLEEARRHLDGETCLEEIRFVLFGEPSYRVFEQVNDAARIGEQMARLADRRRSPEA